VLSIKPLLQVHDGEVAPFERVRTRARAIERLHEIGASEARASRMFIGTTGDDPAADGLVERLRPGLPHTDIAKAFLGPIVGVYTGPNALGIATLERE
jgi:fatty acid-binding protein DegV